MPLLCDSGFTSSSQRLSSSSVPSPVGVQTPAVDGAQLLKDLETLSADDMEGRLPGTPGAAKARAYIVRRFKEAGI